MDNKTYNEQIKAFELFLENLEINHKISNPMLSNKINSIHYFFSKLFPYEGTDVHVCQYCGGKLVDRINSHNLKHFWACSNWPRCQGKKTKPKDPTTLDRFTPEE